jgi:protein-disulfide isomerase
MRWRVLARLGGIFLNAIFLLFLTSGYSPAQNAAESGQGKGPASKPAAKPDEKSKSPGESKAGADNAPSKASTQNSLPPETVHRVQSEIRSRYNVPPQINIEVSDPKRSEMPGFDQLSVTFTGGTHSTSHDFLISSDRKTLVHLEKFDISQDVMAKINVKGRPVRGNANAKVTIINFDDFQCPFCSRMHSTLFPSLLQSYGDRVRIIYKDYPLVEIHPWAMHAAVDGNCLNEQNNEAYWDFADFVHANQKNVAGKSRAEALVNLDSAAKDQAQKHQLDQEKLQACMSKQDEAAVRASMAEADAMGVDSTPTLFINGEKLSGVVPEQELKTILDRALADSGQQAPPANLKK